MTGFGKQQWNQSYGRWIRMSKYSNFAIDFLKQFGLYMFENLVFDHVSAISIACIFFFKLLEKNYHKK